MFNSYHHHSGGGTKRVEVKQTTHEHRAPTDDSIRLYDEIRQKAVDSIVARGRAPLAADVTWAVIDCPMIGGFEIVGVFTLNKQEHQLCVPVRDVRYRQVSGEINLRLLQGEVYKALVDQIAKVMTEDMFRRHLYQLAESVGAMK